MVRRRTLTTALAAAAVLAIAACGGGTAATAAAAAAAAAEASGKVGVILPDTTSSPRWESQDRPKLEAAFKAAGVDYDIQNAQNDAQKMQTIAQQMITGGVTVLAIVNLDSASGAAIEQQAKQQGVPDDRLRPAHAGRLGGLLRVLRQHQGRRAPGRGAEEVPR